jgi:DHA3 family multidrug efflux protein-like MFS transporter
MFTAINFGNIVDHNKKHTVILRSSIGSATAYLLGAIIYFSNDPAVFTTVTSRQLRLLIITLMSGTIIGNLRNIALSTSVSLLLPTEEHAKANGKIGTVNGVWFTLTSVASGLVIWFLGMGWAIAWAAVIMLLVIGHLMTFTIPEQTIFSAHADQEPTPNKKLNIRETIATISEIQDCLHLSSLPHLTTS